jgi:transposase-like protein
MDDTVITLVNGQQVTADEFYRWSASKQYWNLVPRSEAFREAALKSKRQAVQTPKGLFDSVGAAAAAYNTNPNTLRNWIVKKPTEFYYLNNSLSEQRRKKMSDAQLARGNKRGRPRGLGMSVEARKKISDAKRNNPVSRLDRRKPVHTPKGFFDSIGAATQAYDISGETLRRWIKNNPTEFYYVDKPL